jgi:hypothetical protein
MTYDEQEYAKGRAYGDWWIKHNGNLKVDEFPENWSDAKCNGFSDRLVEERDKPTGEWVIVYTDGAYEAAGGSGFPCKLLSEAAKFETKEAAEEHAVNLCDVDEIKQI